MKKKIVFIDFPIAKTIKDHQFLEDFHCSYLESNSPTFEKTLLQKPTLSIFLGKTIQTIALIKKWKQQFPHTWIILITSRISWEDPIFKKSILDTLEINDLLFYENWISDFPLTMHRFYQVLKLQRELLSIAEEKRIKEREFEFAFQSTSKLIQKMEKDLALTTRIQKTLLSKIQPIISGLSISVKYFPALGKGSDYYDLIPFDKNRKLAILLSDSKTHGLTVSLLSALLKIKIHDFQDRFQKPSSFLSYLDEELSKNHSTSPSTMHFLYGILDRKSLLFSYSYAGKIHAFVISQKMNKVIELDTKDLLSLGKPEKKTFQEGKYQLYPGDMLLLFTDGLYQSLQERWASPSKKEDFFAFLSKDLPTDHVELKNEILGQLQELLDGKILKDDLTLVLIGIEKNAMYLIESQKDKEVPPIAVTANKKTS